MLKFFIETYFNGRLTLQTSVFLSLLAIESGAQDWLSGYDFRKQITFDGASISGSHTDFPVLLELSSDAQLQANANANGFDIAFTESDGFTEIDFELISYNNGNGALLIYLKTDLTSSTDKDVFMYYGNSSISTDQSSSNTWSNNFEAVLHLQESGNGTDDEYSDSSGNGRHGTGGGLPGAGSNATTPNQISSTLWGNTQDFTAANNDRIRLQAIDDNSWTAVTVQAWINADVLDDDRLFGKCWGTGGDDETWLMRQTTVGLGTRLRTNLGNTERDDGDDGLGTTNDNAGNWYLGAITWDDATDLISVYINGNLEESVGRTGSNFTVSDVDETDFATIGNVPGGGRAYDGKMQEARVSDVARSANWLLTQYNIESDPTSFVKTLASQTACGAGAPDGGTATPDDAEVFSGSGTTIRLTGHTSSGTTIQWQSSTDGTNYSNVGVNSNTYATGNLTQTTFFRAIVDNTSCEVVSTIAIVTVKTSFGSGVGPSGYALRRKITIQSSEVSGSGSHTNFPVLIRLTGSKAVSDLIYKGNGGDVAHMKGYDIIFTTDDESTELEHQIEHYDPVTGEYVGWVLIPSLSATIDTDIYMYYGNGSVTTDPSDDIFDTDYLGVWHLHDGFEDAVSTGNDGVGFGNVTSQDGIIAEALKLDPVNGSDFTRVEVGAFEPATTAITVSAWINRDVTNNGKDDGRIISKTDGQAAGSHVFMLSIENNNDLRIRLTGTEANDTNAETVTKTAVNTDFTPGTWVFGAYTWSANGTIRIYEDGVEIDTDNNLNDREKIEQNTGFKVAIGNNPGPADGGDPVTRKPFDGFVDEMRVSKLERSADWILTEYNNQKENSNFCTIGEEEGCVVLGGTASALDENIFTNEITSISLEDEIGSSIQWQESTDNITYASVSGGSGGTTDNYTTAALTETTYFRALVTEGTCSVVSNIEAINVQGRFLSNYAHRKAITIDSDQVSGSGSFTDFPVLISITNDNDLRTVSNGGNVYDEDAGNGTVGDDITFTDQNGNELTYYRESYDDANGTLIAWVKIPTLSAIEDTQIFLYYGNCTGSGLPNITNTNTWNSGFEAVWLLNDNTGNIIADATINSRNGTSANTANSTGQIGNGQLFNSAADNITVSSFNISSSSLTIFAWINPANAAIASGERIVEKASAYSLRTQDNSLPDDALRMEVTNTNPTTQGITTLPSDITNSWMHVVGVWDGNEVRIFENGNPLDLETAASLTGTLQSNGNDILIGNDNGGTNPFDGTIDHVTISNVARSDDWIKTTYNNENDPGSFFTVGSEESQIQWIGNGPGDVNDLENPNNWSNCQVPGSTESVFVPSSGVTNFPALTTDRQLDDLIIDTGASFDLAGFTVTLTGRLTNNGTFTHNGGQVTFSGTTEQQISGSSSVTLNDVEINNSGPGVKIATSTTIDQTLTFTSGFIILEDDALVIGPNGSITGEGSSAFVITNNSQCLEQEDIGQAARIGSIVFPVGTSNTSYTPVTLDNTPGTADDFCVRVSENVYSEGFTGSGNLLTTEALDKTWFISEQVNGGSDIILTLSWNGVDELSGFDRADMLISHYVGSDWVPYGTGIVATGSDPYTASVSNVTSFSPVGGGSGGSPLPIELGSFEAILDENTVRLEWTTITEEDNDFFTIERSPQLEMLESIATVNGAGNSNRPIKYTYIDQSPLPGMNYYRLKQTDFDGNFSYSKTVLVDFTPVLIPEISIYPNPGLGHFTLQLTGFDTEQSVMLEIFTIDGSKILQSRLSVTERGKTVIPLDLNSSHGVIVVRITGEGLSLTKRLIIGR